MLGQVGVRSIRHGQVELETGQSPLNRAVRLILSCRPSARIINLARTRLETGRCGLKRGSNDGAAPGVWVAKCGLAPSTGWLSYRRWLTAVVAAVPPAAGLRRGRFDVVCGVHGQPGVPVAGVVTLVTVAIIPGGVPEFQSEQNGRRW